MISGRALGAFWLLVLSVSCARQPAPSPAPLPGARGTAASGERSRLPPVPAVRGPLDLRVVYPPADAVIAARDSSFLLGTAGTGDALVTVNGMSVPVWPNGAWLAWVPLPPDSLMRFEVRARSPRDSAELVYLARRAPRYVLPPPPPPPPPPAPVWIDSTSLTPRGRLWIQPGEYVTLAARAAAGAVVRLRLGDGSVVPLPPESGLPESERYLGVLRGRRLGSDPGPILPAASHPPATAAAVSGPAASVPPATAAASRSADTPTSPPAALLPPPASGRAAVDTTEPVLEAIRGSDTARVRWPVQLALLDTLPVVVELNDDPIGLGGSDSLTVGRAVPGGTYHWFFPTGTRAVATARLNDELRLDLAPATPAWVPVGDALPLPAGTPAPRATVGSLTLSWSAPDRAQLRVPLGVRVPFRVDEGDRRLELTLYGAGGNVNWIRYGAADSLLRRVGWSQGAGGEVRLEVELAHPVWGYRARWSGTDLVLEIRRPPIMQGGHPLEGRLIVVDPGHPPAGAVGPTGLREADANLAVALRLRARLERAGAKVVLTRTTDMPVELWPRVRLADSLGSDLLVSIHNNALPDGMNPFVNNGTSVFYNHPRSIRLARAIQDALVKRLGLRDLGIARGDLAVTRPTWMPAVLCEGLFIIIPDQESALRSEKGQELYARAVAEGIEKFLNGVNGER